MKFHPFVWSSFASLWFCVGMSFYFQTNKKFVMSVTPPLLELKEYASQSTQGGLCLVYCWECL